MLLFLNSFIFTFVRHVCAGLFLLLRHALFIKDHDAHKTEMMR